MKFFRSISNQLSVIIFSSFLMMGIIFFVGYYYYTMNTNEKRFNEEISRRVENLASSISDNIWNLDEITIERVLKLFHSDDDVVSINVESEDINFFYPAKNDKIKYITKIKKNIFYNDKIKSDYMTDEKIGNIEIVFTNEKNINENNKLFLTFFIVLLALVVIISVLIRYSVNRILRKSFDTFAYGFRKIADRDYDYISTMKKKGSIKYEFIPLLFNLNKMSEDIKNQMIKKENIEKELIKANNSKDDFLSNTTHEMKTPLHGIISYANFGIKKIDKVDKDKLLYYFEQIKSSGKTLEKFQNDILDISKYQAKMTNYTMEDIDIRKLIENIKTELSSLLSEKSIKLEVLNNLNNLNDDNSNIKVKSSIVRIDIFKIQQVIRNIFSNAILYSDSDTKILVILDRAKNLKGRRAGDSALVEGISIQIIDEGKGIPEKELETIFEKFYQSTATKSGAGGTGLGLTISREIILGHKGKIWAENNFNSPGSSFYIELPLNLKKFNESFIEK